LGLFLSSLDVGTDASMTYVFYENGDTTFGNLTMGFVLVCLLMQCLLVLMQNQKRAKGVIIRELLYVVTFTKPVVDCLRAASGEPGHSDNILGPLIEYVTGKLIEMSMESIPSAVVQTYALLSAPGGETKKVAIFSVIVSCLLTAFTSTSVSYDLDVDSQKRKDTPTFYGYIPNNSQGRALAFLSMLMFSTAYLLAKTLGMALLARARMGYLALYLVGDLSLLLLYKVVRRDFSYWLPIDSTIGNLAMSTLARIVNKLLTDFTGKLLMYRSIVFTSLSSPNFLLSSLPSSQDISSLVILMKWEVFITLSIS
jgi:hypothetical protein